MKKYDYREIVGKFRVPGIFTECVRYGEGHINDTYKVTTEEKG